VLNEYNDAGNVTENRDAMGNWTGTGYDILNRVTSVTDQDNGATTLTVYDLAGEAIATLSGHPLITSKSDIPCYYLP
jgi:YD repeat-containing protein